MKDITKKFNVVALNKENSDLKTQVETLTAKLAKYETNNKGLLALEKEIKQLESEVAKWKQEAENNKELLQCGTVRKTKVDHEAMNKRIADETIRICANQGINTPAINTSTPISENNTSNPKGITVKTYRATNK